MSSVKPSGDKSVDWLFEPEWAGGWAATRVLWALAAFLAHTPRITGIGDVYAAPDMIFASGWYRLSELFYMTPTHAYLLWAIGMLGIGMVAFGGRSFRPGMLLWLIGTWSLLSYEALNIKAYDRLLTWIALALIFSPAGERDLAHKYRSPAPATSC